jgi:hypothetical protein
MGTLYARLQANARQLFQRDKGHWMLLAPQHDAVLLYAHADDADGVRVGSLMQADGSTVWQLLRVAVGTPNSASGIGAAARSNHQASQCVHHAAAGSHRVRSKPVRRGRPCQHPGAGALTHAVARVCGGHGGCG